MSSSAERGEGRVRKDRKGQSVSDRLGPWAFVCVVFVFDFVIFAPESRGRLRQKGPFSKMELECEKRGKKGCGERKTEGRSVKIVQRTIYIVTISVNSTQEWAGGASHYLNIALTLIH